MVLAQRWSYPAPPKDESPIDLPRGVEMAHEKEVLFQERLADGRFRCLTCPHACRLAEGAFGRCGVRVVREGRLVSLTAERVVAVHADPIEKKPLYHALPGTRSLSFGAPGCNLTCTFCQNCSISQLRGGPLPGERVDPVRLARVAREQGCPSLCATYTEPTIFFELARAAGRAAREAGLRNFWVSNGYMSAPVRRDLAAWVDGINIDLKAFRDDFYRTLCGGRLAPVRESIADLAERGVWVEVTTLVIPGRNDGEEELGDSEWPRPTSTGGAPAPAAAAGWPGSSEAWASPPSLPRTGTAKKTPGTPWGGRASGCPVGQGLRGWMSYLRSLR